MNPQSRQDGFTLVEVLIAIVVLSIGLLGVAKLVMSAVHADDSAYMRGQATQLAYELLDSMRANRPGALDGSYTAPGTYTDCIDNACTADQLAQLDMYNWIARCQQVLPGGCPNGVAPVNMPTATLAEITVTWDDSMALVALGGAPGTMNVILESGL